MPTYKTAKKKSKWYNAYLHCCTWGVLFPEHKTRRRVSKSKMERVKKNLNYWQRRNCIEGWDWGHPAAYYFDKKQRCKIFKYLD